MQRGQKKEGQDSREKLWNCICDLFGKSSFRTIPNPKLLDYNIVDPTFINKYHKEVDIIWRVIFWKFQRKKQINIKKYKK